LAAAAAVSAAAAAAVSAAFAAAFVAALAALTAPPTRFLAELKLNPNGIVTSLYLGLSTVRNTKIWMKGGRLTLNGHTGIGPAWCRFHGQMSQCTSGEVMLTAFVYFDKLLELFGVAFTKKAWPSIFSLWAHHQIFTYWSHLTTEIRYKPSSGCRIDYHIRPFLFLKG